jgi:hypothetical protein
MKKLVLTILIVFVGLPLLAQEAILAAGGDANDSGGSVSYSVGQVVYTINTGINDFVVEGVQQPYEISVVVGIEQAKDINLICRAYPNPASDFLTLEVEIAANEKLFFQLYDIMGKLLVSKRLIDLKTTIPMTNLPPATYFLKVTDNQKVVKTFKIIKNQ